MNEGCEQIRMEMSAYVAGERAPDDWKSLRDHLGHCEPCARECVSMRSMWDQLGEWADEDPPAHVIARVRNMIVAPRSPAVMGGVLRGILEGAGATLLLWGLGRLVPVSVLCSTCHEMLRATPLAQYPFLDELFAGLMLALPSVLAIQMVRSRWNQSRTKWRGIAAALAFGLGAGLGSPAIHLVVGSFESLAAWFAGCALGGSLFVLGPPGRLEAR